MITTFAVQRTKRVLLLIAVVGLAPVSGSTVSYAGTQGSFAAPILLPSGGGPRALAIADFDGDGRRDIATSTDTGLNLYRNQSSAPGTISFGSAQRQSTTGSDPCPPDLPASLANLHAVDLDRDGNPDLVGAVRRFGLPQIDALRNTSSLSTLSFSPKCFNIFGARPMDPNGYSYVTAANLNHDDRPDLAVSIPTNDRVFLLEGTGDPGNIDFRRLQQSDNPSLHTKLGITAPRGVTAAKLDLDSLPDLAVAIDPGPGEPRPRIGVLINTTQNPVNFPAAPPFDFGPKLSVYSGPGHTMLHSVDLNIDGKPDLIAVQPEADRVVVYPHRPPSPYTPGTGGTRDRGDVEPLPYDGLLDPVSFGTGRLPIEVAIGDVNDDGLPDLAVVNLLGGTISVLTNQSDKNTVRFYSSSTLNLDSTPIDVDVSDLDRDGDGDIVVSLPVQNALAVFENLTHAPKSLVSGPGAAAGQGSKKQKPPRPSVNVRFTKHGDLKVTVKARGPMKLKKVSVLLRKYLKKRLRKNKRLKKRFLKKLQKNKANSPRNARYKLTGSSISTYARSKKKGAVKFSFTVRRGYLQRQRSCKMRLRIKVVTWHTDATRYRKTAKPKPSKKACGKRNR